MGKRTRRRAVRRIRAATPSSRASPGCEGGRELASDEVENPYQRGEREKIVRNIRVSTADTMLARRQITEAQKMAWDRCARLYEMMRMSPMVVNLSRAGGRNPVAAADAGAERILKASQTIGALRGELGIGFRIVELVCAQGHSIQEAAQFQFCMNVDGSVSRRPTEKEIYACGRVFRLSLDKMAQFFGYASDSKGIHDSVLLPELQIGPVGIRFVVDKETPQAPR